LEILSALPPEEVPEHITDAALHQVMINISQALQRQTIAADNLHRGLMYLNQALLPLLPPIVIEVPVAEAE